MLRASARASQSADHSSLTSPPILTAVIEPPQPGYATAQAKALKIVKRFGEEWNVGVTCLDLAWLDSQQGPRWDMDPHFRDLD